MIQVIPREEGLGSYLGKVFGEGLGRGAVRQYETDVLEKSLGKLSSQHTPEQRLATLLSLPISEETRASIPGLQEKYGRLDDMLKRQSALERQLSLAEQNLELDKKILIEQKGGKEKPTKRPRKKEGERRL